MYLHYAFDLWAQQWRRREATGNVIFVRFADDIVAGFEHERDARRFWDAMRARFKQFGLALHEEKTRLLEFGRHAAVRRQRRGLGKPETFNFLGFTFYCGRSRRGAFLLHRKTRADRMRAKLREIKDELTRCMHAAIPAVGGAWVLRVPRGADQLPGPGRVPLPRRYGVATGALQAQPEGHRMRRIVDAWLPLPRILHPWPNQRFAVTHPR